MRTPLWETSPGALAALLNSLAPLHKADVYTVTLLGGQVLRWSGTDVPLTLNGHTYALGPGITRNRLRWVVGVEVSTLDLTLTDIQTAGAGTSINGVPLLAFIRARGLYGARVQLDRVFWGALDAGPVGALQWFTGRVGETDLDRYAARLTVKSDIELLDVMVPRDVYQPGCLNTLYDSQCGVNRSGRIVSGAAAGASNVSRISFPHALAQASGYFSLGVVTFTAGPNAGISRTVKTHSASTLTVLQPWPFAVSDGDAFTIYPGCDKSLSTCEGTFANRLRFRGQPFIPVAETVT